MEIKPPQQNDAGPGAAESGELERRISSAQIDSSLRFVTVGCYECHGLNTDKHKDAFEHNGYILNVIVSPNDCATCHSEERRQYANNLMAHAYGNLVDNTLYQDFIKTVNNPYKYSDHALQMGQTDMLTEYESCLYCHGSKVTVNGLAVRETDYGDYEFPVLDGWPNQGVGTRQSGRQPGSLQRLPYPARLFH
jgi:hydroxylamine dehydrogenase